ncbi:hypothetical protein BB561_004046 [Smittium simulii]|uniref:AAA+ ATPase domain-containing protein n=1 Tax=Smittium simulii TaxID=133385 RepID=A0A2T9YID7_9FUNG|nr:hypothetical protein BB561_004046 [Smittium simulii]
MVAEWYINVHLDQKCKSAVQSRIKSFQDNSNLEEIVDVPETKPLKRNLQTRLPAFKKPKKAFHDNSILVNEPLVLEKNIYFQKKKKIIIDGSNCGTNSENSQSLAVNYNIPDSAQKNISESPNMNVAVINKIEDTPCYPSTTMQDIIVVPPECATSNSVRPFKPPIDKYIPLSEKLRPMSLDDFEGQDILVGQNGILRKLIEADRIPSMIFWGPPGSGKTSLAKIIANKTNALFKEFSATSESVSTIRKFVDDISNSLFSSKNRTILFIDEIHRFNKLQQDVFLPLIEKGKVILIGATTENPSFKLNPALLSRCRAFVLEKLEISNLKNIIKKAALVKSEAIKAHVELQDSVVEYIANVSDGDARSAVSILDIAIDSKDLDDSKIIKLELNDVSKTIEKTTFNHNKDEHYDLISAFHKSMRGSNENGALYWLSRMISGGEDPLYIARRLVRFASEDVGMADCNALQIAVAAMTACEKIGYPECDVILAHCSVYMARAKKSVEVYKAIKLAKQFVKDNKSYPVPLHLRNAPTQYMKNLGFSEGYKYNPDFKDQPVIQEYLPSEINSIDFFVQET